MTKFKIIFINLITIALTAWQVGEAYHQRGYFAIGGEWLIPVLVNFLLIIKITYDNGYGPNL